MAGEPRIDGREKDMIRGLDVVLACCRVLTVLRCSPVVKRSAGYRNAGYCS